MEESIAAGGLDPISAFALVGAIGVGAQWLAWRLRMPAIVLMLVAGILIGPVSGIFDPDRDIGPLYEPMISLAVAVILFEGGLTLSLNTLRDAAEGVKRLVFIGAPLGWLLSALALHYAAGLGWESSAVLGGIMIVTGPTVIAPLLRTSRLARRPAALLQWEAIVNDPLGALAAIAAFEVIVVLRTATDWGGAFFELATGGLVAVVLGAVGGYGLSWALRRAKVPEYMKVPVLFVVILAVFAASDAVLHESGLLAVTIMGIVLANANLPSYEEMRRFKEHATILLVSGVFILLAASVDFTALGQLNWRAAVFVAAVVLLARPLTVYGALASTKLPWKERTLIAFTAPRGVVLVAVAGLFGERLMALGIDDAVLIGPLAFVLVAVTVIIHGFTLAPVARALGLTAAETPGVLIVGGSRLTVALAEALKENKVPVLLTDPNRTSLRAAREAGIPTFFGDILSEAAEHRVEILNYRTALAATNNDAYNTLVATDLAPEFGREFVYQTAREKAEHVRHALPASLGGRPFGDKSTYNMLNQRMWQGWEFRVTGLTDEFTLTRYRDQRPEAVIMAQITKDGQFQFVTDDEELRVPAGASVVALIPPAELEKIDAPRKGGGQGEPTGGGPGPTSTAKPAAALPK
ncbi:sodium:proton antiporter [Mesobaculum littorinae]|uniref:Sodium:proton antiporter n=1 Tax=Mesobaculum littorinae TaxID=2486419 RepID=A0A438ALF7_9RHOB|nr:sodium:proton antiporter [Mesobaculum littorinae]RVV99435.1 sodium:proton antiporter [Mesobaculum littorinae]